MKKEQYVKPEKREIGLSIKISKSMKKFIKDNNISATKLFIDALKQVGFKQ